MKAQCWMCIVLLSAVAVCAASGTAAAPAAAVVTDKQTNAQNMVDKHNSTIPESAASASARQQASKLAVNATAPAPTPAEHRPARRAAAGDAHHPGTVNKARAARVLRNRRLGQAAARRAGLRRGGGRQLGQRHHARSAMQQHEINRIAAGDAVRAHAAATAAPAAAGASAPSAGTSSGSRITSTSTSAAAAGQQPAREPDSSKLQQQKYFTITDLTGSRAIEIGKTLMWREGQLLRPAADSASGPADWQLVKVEARGEQHSSSGSELAWVTACGYLQWSKSGREVQFTAEVDGCSEVINYAARRRDDPDYPTQFGLLLITVAVDNCVYSHCEQAGCGSACKCVSKQTGKCSCGDSTQTGFAPYYSWPQNRQSCAHTNISVVADSSSRSSGDGSSREESATLFEARRGSGQIVVPIRFGNTANCLPPLASRRLQVHSVKCTKTSSKADNSRQALPAKPAAAAAQAGSLQGGCNRADGTYLVVVGVPKAAGQYSCSVTFNDDWEDRLLAELRVI